MWPGVGTFLSFRSQSVKNLARSSDSGMNLHALTEDGVESPPVDLIMVGNGQGLAASVPQQAADLDVTASLRELFEPEFLEDLQNVAA